MKGRSKVYFQTYISFAEGLSTWSTIENMLNNAAPLSPTPYIPKLSRKKDSLIPRDNMGTLPKDRVPGDRLIQKPNSMA